MTYEEMMKIEYSKGEIKGREEGRKVGREEGREQGVNNMLTLISKMSADGMTQEISRLSTDEEFLKEMLQKYQL